MFNMKFVALKSHTKILFHFPSLLHQVQFTRFESFFPGRRTCPHVYKRICSIYMRKGGVVKTLLCRLRKYECLVSFPEKRNNSGNVCLLFSFQKDVIYTGMVYKFYVSRMVVNPIRNL